MIWHQLSFRSSHNSNKHSSRARQGKLWCFQILLKKNQTNILRMKSSSFPSLFEKKIVLQILHFSIKYLLSSPNRLAFHLTDSSIKQTCLVSQLSLAELVRFPYVTFASEKVEVKYGQWKLPGVTSQMSKCWSTLIQNCFISGSALSITWNFLDSVDSALNTAKNETFQS